MCHDAHTQKRVKVEKRKGNRKKKTIDIHYHIPPRDRLCK